MPPANVRLAGMGELDDTWGDLFDALPDGWTAHRPVYRTEERRWYVNAGDYRPVKRTRHQLVESVGMTEERALRDLAGLLRQWQEEEPEPTGNRAQRI